MPERSGQRAHEHDGACVRPGCGPGGSALPEAQRIRSRNGARQRAIALAGIGNLVDFDQTVAVMDKVGRSLPFELRESALGGIAAAPAACAWCAQCGA